jgi:uncharacterized protein
VGDDVVLAATVLAYGVVAHTIVPRSWQVPANLAAAVGAAGIARGAGTTWRELGLEPADAPDGLRLGLATLPAIGAAVALALASPTARRFFADERVSGSSTRELAYHAFVRIPLATALTEELLFRSALYGVGLHAHGRDRAVASSAIAFGLWHIIPALRSHDANPAGADLADRVGGRAGTVAATVLATAAAGVGFAWLRTRSRSVVASAVAHAGMNIAGLAAAAWVARQPFLSGGGPPSGVDAPPPAP